MPIYEYLCEKCGAEFEVTQKITDPPLKRHNGSCRGKVRKLMSSNSFHLKGTGWYKTDYAGGNSGGGNGSSPDKSKGDGETPASDAVKKDTAKEKSGSASSGSTASAAAD